MLAGHSLPSIVASLRRLRAAVADPEVQPAGEEEERNCAYGHIISHRVAAVMALLAEGGGWSAQLNLDPALPLSIQAKLEELQYVLAGGNPLIFDAYHRIDNRPGMLLFLDDVAGHLKGAPSALVKAPTGTSWSRKCASYCGT